MNAIVGAGFNGIRFPMWPDGVGGPDPEDALGQLSKSGCDDLTKFWISQIKNADSDKVYKDLYIYLSPGLDNRIF